MIRARPLAVGILAWGAGAATAVAVSLLALPLVGVEFGVEAGQPVTDDPLARTEPAPTASATPLPSAPATPAATPTAAGNPGPGTDQRTVSSPGGTVVARCTGPNAYIVYWTPAQGYHAEEVVRGPAPTARLKFEGLGKEFEVTITCPGGQVHSVVKVDH